MKKELIPYFLEIQELQIQSKDLEKKLITLQTEYESFKNENLTIINNHETELKTIRDMIKNLKSQQKEKEDQIVILKEKLANEEKVILTLKNPKEVMHMEKEIENLKTLISKMEDDILNIMIKIDENEKLEQKIYASLREMKENFEKRLKEYEDNMNLLKSKIEELTYQISTKRSSISDSDLEEFDKLSKQKNYKAIAKIINKDICEGCKLSVPKLVLEKLKKGEIVNCPSCGRILWME